MFFSVFKANIYKYFVTLLSISEKLSLSEAAISKQLKLLYKAKIVSKERDGNYVNYHLDVKVLDSLVYLLYEIIL